MSKKRLSICDAQPLGYPEALGIAQCGRGLGNASVKTLAAGEDKLKRAVYSMNRVWLDGRSRIKEAGEKRCIER